MTPSTIPTTEDAKRYARDLRKDSQFTDEIKRFDAKSRLKVYLLNGTFLLSLVAFVFANESWWLVPALILINGVFALPNLRVFIHSEAHWGLSESRVGTWYMRFIAFALYQVPFEAYRVGHFAHHQYDNDVPERDHTLAKDRQSTYLYSHLGKPIAFLAWALHYLFVYQYLHQFVLVIKRTNRKKIAVMALQAAIIVAADVAIFLISAKFFLTVFVPSLAIAWIGSAIVLYMMHKVKFSDARYHHSVNSYSSFFNRFGDNDGMHVVHSMVPFLHPFHQARVNDLIKDGLHPDQSLRGHYVVEFFKDQLRLTRRSAAQ